MAPYSFLKTVKALCVGLLGAVAVGGGSALAKPFSQRIAQSQIVPDNTTGSVVVPFSGNDMLDAIVGGVENSGSLFHNFQDFNVGEGRGVYFFSPSENIQTIFSSVTGDSSSSILGTLGTTGQSAPDLWLINPNGILFGPNSQLDLGGAFIATTANAVQVEGIGIIAASDVADDGDILTINNSVFAFNRDNPNARIINQSQSPIVFSPNIPLNNFDDYAGLEVLPGQTIGLISRDISLQGGGLNTLHGGIVLLAVEDIELTNGATIQAGNVLIDANRLSVQDGSQILTQFTDPRISDYISYLNNGGFTSFSITPDDFLQTLVPIEIGNISISARESVNISGASADSQRSSRVGTGAVGALRTGGNITLETDRLTVAEGGQITSNYLSVSDGNEGGGTIDIDSPLVDIRGSFLVPESANSDLKERLSEIYVGGSIITPADGNVEISSEEFNLLDGARIFVNLSERTFSENTPFFQGGINIESTSAFISGISEHNTQSILFSQRSSSSDGKTTPITITADSLTVQEGAGILGQDIRISLSETLSIEDNSIVSTVAENASDSIQIEAQNIRLQDNARIRGSEVELSALDSVEIESSASLGRFDSTTIQVGAQNIRLQDNARIQGSEVELSALGSVEIAGSASVGRDSEAVFGRSEDAVIQIEAQNILLRNNARIQGSQIELSALGAITLEDRTQISTEDNSVFSSRSKLEQVNLNAGEIMLDDEASISSSNVRLSGGIATLREQATVSANQQRYGSSGDISISVNQLNILESAQLSASIGRPGNGGSIDIDARDTVSIVGDVDSARPSSIRATSDGPGTGGQIAIRTRQLDIQNGSQIVASLNGGGTGGSVVIEAEESVNVSGESKSGQPSGIFADSNLENGEFVVIRSIREDNQSPQFISMLLDTEVILFTQAPSLIRSIPRTGNTGSNQIFLNYEPPNDDPRSAENLFPNRDNVDKNRLELINSVTSSGEQIVITEEPPSQSFDNTEVPTNQSTITGSTVFNAQQVGTARQVLFSHFNVPDRGVLITGQSMSTNLAESIQGGERVFLTSEEMASLRSDFIESIESIKDIELVELEDIETDPDEFAGTRQESIFNDLDAISTAFSNNAGELFIIESTGEELRIRDDRYTDTRFTDIQPGDRFLVFAVRDGGDISIQTGSLNVSNGAEISATSTGAATGNSASSNLNIIADTVEIENNAVISSISDTGTGGNISIQTPTFTLRDSVVTAEARENASGGNITVGLQGSSNVGEIIVNNGRISSRSSQAGGGNVSLTARNITLQGDSDIETSVSAGTGNGGNITLSAEYIIAFDDSDLFAFSGSGENRGTGGNITLNSPSFFGEGFSVASLQARPGDLQGNDRVDINATGSVNGIVSVPDVSFVQDTLVDLPDNLIASEQLISSSCIASREDGQGTLVETGSDGLAINPDSASASLLPTGTVQAISNATTQATERSPQTENTSIEEPTGIYQLADGRLVMGQTCL